jgi:hypothetical protein
MKTEANDYLANDLTKVVTIAKANAATTKAPATGRLSKRGKKAIYVLIRVYKNQSFFCTKKPGTPIYK